MADSASPVGTLFKWGLILFVLYLLARQFGQGEAVSFTPPASVNLQNIPRLNGLTSTLEFDQTYQSPLLPEFRFDYPSAWSLQTTSAPSMQYPNLPTETVVLSNTESTLTFHVTPQDFSPCTVNFSMVAEQSRLVENILEYRRPDTRSAIYTDNSTCRIEHFQASQIPLEQDPAFAATVAPHLAKFANPPATVLYRATVEAAYQNPDDLDVIRLVLTSLPDPLTLEPKQAVSAQPETAPPRPDASPSPTGLTDVPESENQSAFLEDGTEEYRNSFFPAFALRYPFSWQLSTDAAPSQIPSLLNRTTTLTRNEATLRLYTSPFPSTCQNPNAGVCAENILLESSLLAGQNPDYRERFPEALAGQFIPFYLTYDLTGEIDPTLLAEVEQIIAASSLE